MCLGIQREKRRKSPKKQRLELEIWTYSEESAKKKPKKQRLELEIWTYSGEAKKNTQKVLSNTRKMGIEAGKELKKPKK